MCVPRVGDHGQEEGNHLGHLGFCSQYVACKVIWQIWTGPRKGLKKKRNRERDLVQIETFYEAVPCTLIMTYLLARTFSRADGDEIIFHFLSELKKSTFMKRLI